MEVNLVLFKKNGSQKVFTLTSSITIVGRRHDCDFRISLDSVSRRHCQFSLNNESVKVRDLGSRNGTYLNEKRIDEAKLQPGDYVRIGPVIFGLQIDGEPEEITPPKPTEQKPTKKEETSESDTAIQEASDTFVELTTVNEESDSLPEMDMDGDDDDFLADLEDL